MSGTGGWPTAGGPKKSSTIKYKRNKNNWYIGGFMNPSAAVVPIGDDWREILVRNVIHYVPVLLPNHHL